MTKVVVITYSSKRDRSGNTYHFARFYNPQKGRGVSVVTETGGEENADHSAFTFAGGDWEQTLCFHSILPKRQWVLRRPIGISYEGDPAVKAKLAELFA